MNITFFCARIEMKSFWSSRNFFWAKFSETLIWSKLWHIIILVEREKTFCFVKFLTKSLSICWRQLCWRRSQQPHHEKEFIGQQNISAHRNKLFQRNNILCRDTNLGVPIFLGMPIFRDIWASKLISVCKILLNIIEKLHR